MIRVRIPPPACALEVSPEAPVRWGSAPRAADIAAYFCSTRRCVCCPCLFLRLRELFALRVVPASDETFRFRNLKFCNFGHVTSNGNFTFSSFLPASRPTIANVGTIYKLYLARMHGLGEQLRKEGLEHELRHGLSRWSWAAWGLRIIQARHLLGIEPR